MADVIRVEGARNFRRTLRRAGDDLGDLRVLHAQVAGVVSRSARPPRRTGKLAGTVRPAGTATAAIVRAGFASVPYAGPIHWGWPLRNITAQPFLSDAATGTEAVWVNIYTVGVQVIVDKVKGI